MKKFEVTIACEYAGGHIGRTSRALIVNAASESDAGKIAIAEMQNAKTAYGEPMFENCTVRHIEEYVEPSKEETAWFDEMFQNW